MSWGKANKFDGFIPKNSLTHLDSLTSGLSEQHFLDTIYPNASKVDFEQFMELADLISIYCNDIEFEGTDVVGFQVL